MPHATGPTGRVFRCGPRTDRNRVPPLAAPEVGALPEDLQEGAGCSAPGGRVDARPSAHVAAGAASVGPIEATGRAEAVRIVRSGSRGRAPGSTGVCALVRSPVAAAGADGRRPLPAAVAQIRARSPTSSAPRPSRAMAPRARRPVRSINSTCRRATWLAPVSRSRRRPEGLGLPASGRRPVHRPVSAALWKAEAPASASRAVGVRNPRSHTVGHQSSAGRRVGLARTQGR